MTNILKFYYYFDVHIIYFLMKYMRFQLFFVHLDLLANFFKKSPRNTQNSLNLKYSNNQINSKLENFGAASTTSNLFEYCRVVTKLMKQIV